MPVPVPDGPRWPAIAKVSHPRTDEGDATRRQLPEKAIPLPAADPPDGRPAPVPGAGEDGRGVAA